MKFPISLLSVALFAWVEAPRSVQELVSLADNNVLTPEMVAPAVRTEVIERLRKKLNPARIRSRESVCTSLIVLGDEPTIDTVMRDYLDDAGHKRGYGLNPSFPPQPLLIPYFAGSLFEDDGQELTSKHDGCMIWQTFPKSIGCATAVLDVIRASSEFKPEVRDWAEKLTWVEAGMTKAEPTVHPDGTWSRSVPRMAVYRDVMRRWWRENERHFAARDYGAVRSGVSLDKRVLSEWEKLLIYAVLSSLPFGWIVRQSWVALQKAEAGRPHHDESWLY